MILSRFSHLLRMAAVIVAAGASACARVGDDRQDRAAVAPPAAASPAVLAAADTEWRGVRVEVVEAQRTGALLEVRFRVVNLSPQPFEFGNRFASDPADRDTLADTTVAEPGGWRRYSVLRDRDGRPLCSTAVPPLEPGERRVLFARFPAPQEGTSRITIQIPHVAELREVPVGQARK